jgi:hypothetical protein
LIIRFRITDEIGAIEPPCESDTLSTTAPVNVLLVRVWVSEVPTTVPDGAVLVAQVSKSASHACTLVPIATPRLVLAVPVFVKSERLFAFRSELDNVVTASAAEAAAAVAEFDALVADVLAAVAELLALVALVEALKADVAADEAEALASAAELEAATERVNAVAADVAALLAELEADVALVAALVAEVEALDACVVAIPA